MIRVKIAKTYAWKNIANNFQDKLAESVSSMLVATVVQMKLHRVLG